MDNVSRHGISFCEWLGILFIALKLCNVIDWEWYWVLLPIYGPIVILIVALVFCLIMVGVCGLLNIIFDNKF